MVGCTACLFFACVYDYFRVHFYGLCLGFGFLGLGAFPFVLWGRFLLCCGCVPFCVLGAFLCVLWVFGCLVLDVLSCVWWGTCSLGFGGGLI